MRRRLNGVPVYRWCGPSLARVRHGWRLPGREWWYYVERGPYLLLLTWRPYHGIRLAADGRASEWASATRHLTLEAYEMAIKKRDPMAGPRGVPQGPSATSTMLAKLPALREFLSAVTYEDGSARTVGNIRIGSQGRLWEVTIQDPDALARLTMRDESLDRVLMLVEQLLGVEEAPWETDRYLAEKAAKGPKKK